MTTDPTTGRKTPTVHQRRALFAATSRVHDALQDMYDAWNDGFDGDAYGPTTGYPFDSALEDVTANVGSFLTVLGEDLKLAEATAEFDRAKAQLAEAAANAERAKARYEYRRHSHTVHMTTAERDAFFAARRQAAETNKVHPTMPDRYEDGPATQFDLPGRHDI